MATYQSASMAEWLYRLVLAAALPLVWLRLRLRARREPEYGQRIAERFGAVPREITPGCIWVHTVSAGETIAATPLIRQLALKHAPQTVLVTTMTPTGSAQVRSRMADVVQHCYAPYDFGFAVRRFFDRVQPTMLVLMETELWPNMIAEAGRRQIPVYLVNARLSERSAAGYARTGSLIRNMLQRLSAIACQSEAHAARFIELGAPPERVRTLGSVKYDVSLPEGFNARVKVLRDSVGLAGAPVWIAASTHPGEDEQIIQAHQLVRERVPEACLILVPRHPVRAPEICAMLDEAGLSTVLHSALQPSSGPANGPLADVLVGDLMGTLLELYGCADVAFVGGSLVPHGGHNPLEPAVCAKAVISGPHQFNFTQIMQDLAARDGLQTVEDAQQLAEMVTSLLQDEDRRAQLGRAAAAVVQENRGATGRLIELLSGPAAAAQ